MRLKSKVCLITGGTKGIGAAVAIELARHGADIALNGRVDDDEARRVKATVEAAGRKCFVHFGDIGRPSEAAKYVEATAEALGSVDVLIHSAGGAAPGTLLDVSAETWHQAFDIHIHAIFHLCRAAIPWMKKRGEGSIILISSAAGLRGVNGAIAYSVVKGALPQFARSLAREVADDNIRVNCVSPGIIRTRFQDYLTAEQVETNLGSRIPLHREGTPKDVAETIILLAGNDYITGENIVVDGGLTMRIV
jgi:NAD(P)-dependent dehydrogenase (short-subunit alcohol dehydrogenase family)